MNVKMRLAVAALVLFPLAALAAGTPSDPPPPSPVPALAQQAPAAPPPAKPYEFPAAPAPASPIGAAAAPAPKSNRAPLLLRVRQKVKSLLHLGSNS